MKKTFLLILGLLCLVATAQNADSVKLKTQLAITDKFPATRMFDVQYQQFLPTDFDSELRHHGFQKGEIKNHYRVKAAANIKLFTKPRWNITSSFNYKYEAFELNDVENLSAETGPFRYENNPDFHYLSAALSFTYFSQLWKKPLVWNASLIADGSEKDAERIKGLVGATLMLKRTDRTTIGIGIIAFIDQTSPVPIAPVFIYEHQFLNSPWQLDFILPQRLLLKRPVFTNGRISFGSELASDGFYAYANQPGYASVYQFQQLELRSGLTYEHHVNQTIITTFKAGMANVFNAQYTERGQKSNDYILDTDQDATGYFSVGISYNPLLKKKK